MKSKQSSLTSGDAFVRNASRFKKCVFFCHVSLKSCLSISSATTFFLYTIVLSQPFSTIWLEISTNLACSHGSSNSLIHVCQNLIIHSSIFSRTPCYHLVQEIELFTECTGIHTHTWVLSTFPYTSRVPYTSLSWTALGAIFLCPNFAYIHFFSFAPINLPKTLASAQM